jgi:hypothetical protein
LKYTNTWEISRVFHPVLVKKKKKKKPHELRLSIQDFGEDNVRCYQIKNSIYGALRVGCLICDERRIDSIEGRSSELWYWKEGYLYHVIYAWFVFEFEKYFYFI